MEEARLRKILSREQSKLHNVDFLQHYTKKEDIGFTFFMICRALAASGDSLKSRDLHCQMKAFMQARGVTFEDSKWNPVNMFTNKWTQTAKGKPFKAFDPAYIDVIARRGSPYSFSLHDKHANDVRSFFGRDEVVLDNSSALVDFSPLVELGRQLFWDSPQMMEEVAALLLDKRQLIFYGPPGTGKTYVARELARHLSGGEDPTLLQFHPSYSYEDFVEGYRPQAAADGKIEFRKIPGPLRLAADRAKDKRHLLIIDEVNRGNIAKIFGELYFLLEYRDEKIRLQYDDEDDEPFLIPKNLLIIGTMNTADRSISHIDAALRRRFHFFPLFPDKEPIRGLLRRYLQKCNRDLLWVADVVDLANQRLNNRHSSIGHSHFMPGEPSDLNEDWVRTIWKYSIMPLIEERFIDEPDKVGEFELDALRSQSAVGPA